MKKAFYMALLLVLVACEDKFEITNRYSRPYFLIKGYPIYLDPREILVEIQVKPSIPFDAAFKIASNEKYFFIGEKMKGIHVYEKTGESRARPLCFIECKYIKAFDVEGNNLYCNNFTDLLVIDVENPLQAKIKNRVNEYFNNYSYSSYMPVIYNQSINAYVYEIGLIPIVLTGTETEYDPAPDFSEYDELYENFIVNEIPDTIIVDMPFVGFANVEGNIFTLGGDNLIQCSYTDGYGYNNGFTMSPSDFYIPNYESVMPIDNLQYKDGMIFLHGYYRGVIGLDYNKINTQYNGIFLDKVKDAVSIKEPVNSFVFLHRFLYPDFFLLGSIVDEYYNSITYIHGNISDATSLISINDDTILALSSHSITLYSVVYQDMWNSSLRQEKQYPFGGSSMLKDGDRLIVANPQGLFFYDISNLENIVPIP